MATDAADQVSNSSATPPPAPVPASPAPASVPDIDLDPTEYERDDRVSPEQMAEYLAKQKPAPKTPEASVAPPDVPAPAPASPQHDPRWVAMARGIGLSDADISGLSPNELPNAVTLLHRQQQAWQARQQQPPAGPPAPEAEPEYKIEGLDESKWDAELVSPFKKALSKKDKELKELKVEVAAIKQAAVVREEQEFVARAEAFFAQHPEVYGKGDVNTIDKSSPDFFRRLRVIKDAFNEKRPLEQVHSAYFGGLIPASAPKTPAAPPVPVARPNPAPVPETPVGPSPQELAILKRWEQGALQPPTQRTTELPKGRDKAIASAQAILDASKNGTATESLHGSGDEENDFV